MDENDYSTNNSGQFLEDLSLSDEKESIKESDEEISCERNKRGKHSAENTVETGFSTGRNRKIFVRKDTVEKVLDENSTLNIDNIDNTDTGAPATTDTSTKHTDTENKKGNRSNTKKHFLEEIKLEDAREIFKIVAKEFKNDPQEWIKEQFKWTWMHLLVNGKVIREELENTLIEHIKLKKKYEWSTLQNIADGNENPGIHMVLGIIDLQESSMYVYDGYYGARISIDKNIYWKLKQKGCGLGKKIRVFGSAIVSGEKCSLTELRGKSFLRIFYNSVELALPSERYGRKSDISFLNEILRIRRNGGVVSALKCEIMSCIERKYIVTVFRNKMIVNTLEEVEKVLEKYAEANPNIERKDVVVKCMEKYVVKDTSGTCILTSFKGNSLTEGKTYWIVGALPNEKSVGNKIELMATYRTSIWEK